MDSGRMPIPDFILLHLMPVKVSDDLAIVIRKQALSALSLEKSQVLEMMEQDDYYDENTDLIVLGPFWPDGVDELIRRLKGLGLEYVDDFFELYFDRPDWMQLFCAQKDTVSK